MAQGPSIHVYTIQGALVGHNIVSRVLVLTLRKGGRRLELLTLREGDVSTTSLIGRMDLDLVSKFGTIWTMKIKNNISIVLTFISKEKSGR